MDTFIIEGGRPLTGRVRIGGAKNAALPMMAAALLTRERLILRDVPHLRDIESMAEILQELGVSVARRNGEMILQCRSESNCTARYELVSTMRASVCVLGPLVGKRRHARVSLPGGCVIGHRPIDIHLKGLEALGSRTTIDDGYVIADAPHLRGASLYLGGAFGSTVTGTENILMAAVLADGDTTIENAACEPEVEELARLLQKMGARIQGIGTHRLVVHGVKALHGAEHAIIPDRIEAGTFLAAAAIAGGEVTVEHCRPDHLTAVLEAFTAAGIEVATGPDWIRVNSRGNNFRSVDIATLPYPGFPTDMQAQMLAILTLGDGFSIVTEKVYPDRFMHLAELGRMGARIRKEGNSAIVQGVRELRGAPVMASDLRASAALVMAGLAARGRTVVSRVYHIDRGYERIEERLETLGARIRRADEKALARAAAPA